MKVNALAGGLLIGAAAAAALCGLAWTPYDPMALNFAARLAAPGAAHWLGTDEFGRDILSRLMAGAAVSVTVSVATVALALIGGLTLGIIAGYLRGWVDRVIMTLVDALLAFPGILLALGLLAIIGAGKTGLILALGLAYMPSVTRVTRGAVLSVREKEFIEASQVMGNGEWRTMLRHVLPNCLGPLTVLGSSMFGWSLLAESALSFLGLGVPPPAPSWGNMLAGARPFIGQAAWLGVFPGLAISSTLLGINLLGDALRDRLDPRMR